MMMNRGVMNLAKKHFRVYPQLAIKRTFVNGIVTRNQISTDSWASQRLMERGETLNAVEPPLTLCTEELLKNTPPKIAKLSEEILKLNVVEVQELLMTMQARLGYQADALYGTSSSAAAEVPAEVAAPKAVEKDTFDLKLGVVDAKAKIKIIKEVRAITGLGLKEAKDLVEKAPTVIKQGLKKEEAEGFLKLLTGAGGEAELL